MTSKPKSDWSIYAEPFYYGFVLETDAGFELYDYASNLVGTYQTLEALHEAERELTHAPLESDYYGD